MKSFSLRDRLDEVRESDRVWELYQITNIQVNNWEIEKVTIKNNLTWKEYILDVKNLENDIFQIKAAFDLGYIIIDNNYFFEVFIQEGNNIISIQKLSNLWDKRLNTRLFKIYIDIRDNNLLRIIDKLKEILSRTFNKKLNFKLKLKDNTYLIIKRMDISLKVKAEIILKVTFLWDRIYLSLLNYNPDLSKEIWRDKEFLEKLYWTWVLTFPDVVSIYIYWWFSKEVFNYYLRKVLNRDYLFFQINDERFRLLSQNLWADKLRANKFLSGCKTIKECLDTLNKTYLTRYNLYVRLDVIDRLYKEGVISEEDYKIYREDIIDGIKEIIEKALKDGRLGLVDVLSIYFVGREDKGYLKLYLDKILSRKYLLKQLEGESNYKRWRYLFYDREEGVKFLRNCKTIEDCIDMDKYSNNRYNLYVRLIVINKLYKRKIISEGDYERYKKNILYVIDILREMKNLEEEKEKEEENEVKKIKNLIDEFLMTK